MSLENAPDEVKLAVDLIMLLENHEIPAETVLKALEIVRRDFEGKLPLTLPSPQRREGNRLGGSRVVPLNLALHFRMLIAFLVAQMNLKLVKGDINIVFTTQTVNGAVQLIDGVAAIAQFAYVQAQLMIQSARLRRW